MTPLLAGRARSGISAAFAIVAAGLVLVLGGSPAFADPEGDKAKVDHQIARTRAALESASAKVEVAAEAFAQATERLPAVQGRLADARGVLAGAKARAASAAHAVDRAAADLARADKALSRAVRDVERTRGEIGRFAANAYRGRDVAGIDALLSITDPADFVAGLTYMQRVAEAQTAALNANTAARAEQKVRQNAVAARKLAADDAQREADDAVAKAATAESQASDAQQEVAAVVAQREQALKVATAERATVEAQYKELLAESARIAAQIRALAKGGGPVLQPGAKLPMPVVGWKSSDFGMRFDPFYKVWRLHAGVDLAAPAGSPIWAAAAGKVFKAGWNGGYGNYTCIYHGTYQGKGFATCYAHQSAILVKLNQQVRQGQLIGRVGTTGASTGNHLHFEVRFDGDPVNPLPYLPACLC